MISKAFSLTALAVSAAALVAACGGGGGTPTAVETAPVAAGTSVGVLTDSPIGGVEYITSSGYRGFTDASGNYSYNEGETVEFRIGGISLGTVPATGTVTPIQLAGSGTGAANKVINLLVLLQSLDADGNPDNGITIAEAARTAAANVTALDLTAQPATFASAPTLSTLLTSAGVDSTPVSADDALQHFRTQFMSQLAGGWIHASSTKLTVLRFAANGSYLHGENGAPEGGGMAGVEHGTIQWDPATGELSLASTPSVDTNGDWGPSSLTGKEIASFDGDKLVITDPDGTATTFSRIARSTTNPLVGMWTLATSPTDLSRQTFVFFESGNYMMLDPVGDEDNTPPCGPAGIERGTYTFNTTTGEFAVTTAPARDTNDCAGLWDKTAGTGTTLVVPMDQIASGTFSVDGVTFTRVTP